MNSEYIESSNDPILVKGSNGFIGAKVIDILLEYDYTKLRCFVGPSSHLARLEKLLNRFQEQKNVEMIVGDLLSREDCRKAVEGVSRTRHVERALTGHGRSLVLST